jgi:Tfp pilus assembly PilM family ATPase
MKGFDFMNSPGLYLELGQSSLKVFLGDAGLELRLDRLENGSLTGPCRERLTEEVRSFLKRQGRPQRVAGLCALGARGVSLRRLTLPPAGGEELQRLLRLQIESEFPLPPDDLAWGYVRVDESGPSGNAMVARQELLVAAVKKEVVEGYADLLNACGISPIFTLASLARNRICPQPGGSYAVLDLGCNHSELAAFENGFPVSIRSLPWGGEQITQSIQSRLVIDRDEAEQLKLNLDHTPPAPGDRGQLMRNALDAALDPLAVLIKSNWTGRRLYLAGKSARHPDLPARLATRLGNGAECVPLERTPDSGPSAAILGLKQACEKDGRAGPTRALAVGGAGRAAADRLFLVAVRGSPAHEAAPRREAGRSQGRQRKTGHHRPGV